MGLIEAYNKQIFGDKKKQNKKMKKDFFPWRATTRVF